MQTQRGSSERTTFQLFRAVYTLQIFFLKNIMIDFITVISQSTVANLRAYGLRQDFALPCPINTGLLPTHGVDA